MVDEQGLKGGELIRAFRASNIAYAYQFKGDIVRQAATMEFAEKLGRGAKDMEFCENFTAYLRTVGRQYGMSLTEVPDGEMHIHMIIRGGFHIDGSTVKKGQKRFGKNISATLSV